MLMWVFFLQYRDWWAHRTPRWMVCQTWDVILNHLYSFHLPRGENGECCSLRLKCVKTIKLCWFWIRSNVLFTFLNAGKCNLLILNNIIISFPTIKCSVYIKREIDFFPYHFQDISVPYIMYFFLKIIRAYYITRIFPIFIQALEPILKPKTIFAIRVRRRLQRT